MPHFKHGAVEGDVREATIGDDLHARIIEQRLKENVEVGAWGLWETFGRLCSQVVTATGLPFDPTTLHEAEREALEAAYTAFLGLPKRLRKVWEAACDQADAALGDTADGNPNA